MAWEDHVDRRSARREYQQLREAGLGADEILEAIEADRVAEILDRAEAERLRRDAAAIVHLEDTGRHDEAAARCAAKGMSLHRAKELAG